jgi:hypothetical protein
VSFRTSFGRRRCHLWSRQLLSRRAELEPKQLAESLTVRFGASVVGHRCSRARCPPQTAEQLCRMLQCPCIVCRPRVLTRLPHPMPAMKHTRRWALLLSQHHRKSLASSLHALTGHRPPTNTPHRHHFNFASRFRGIRLRQNDTTNQTINTSLAKDTPTPSTHGREVGPGHRASAHVPR